MEAFKKIFRTPSAFVLLLVAIVSLIGIIIQSKTNENIARIPIDATSTAEARLTMSASSPVAIQQTSIPNSPAPTATVTEIANLSNMEFPHYAPVYIRYLFHFRDYNDDYKEPCEKLEGHSEWIVESALAFEIVSVSDNAIDLINILPDNDEIIDTQLNAVRASAGFYFFDSQESFLDWYKIRSSPNSSYVESRKNLVFSAPPIKIESGQMIDILLLVKQKVIIDSSLPTPSDVFLQLHNAEWKSKVTFVFSENEIQEVSVPLLNPYKYSLGSSKSFSLCQEP